MTPWNMYDVPAGTPQRSQTTAQQVMLRTIFYSKDAAAMATWLAILAAMLTVLGWLTPEWFGQLSWPQAIMFGICAALVVSLALSIALAIFAVGYRALRPVPVETGHAEVGHELPTDNTKLRGEFQELRRTVQNVIQDYQTVLANVGNLTAIGDSLKASTAHGREKAEEVLGAAHMLRQENAEFEKRLRAAAGDIEDVRRGCAELEERIVTQEAKFRESVNALMFRERLAGFAAEISAVAENDLFLPLKNGERYDRERWASWESCHTHWNAVLQNWIDDARWYAKDVKTRVMTVDDREYDDTNWTVADEQFPNADAVRRFKRHRIIHRHWNDVKGDVERGAQAVAYGALSERECHGGQYHQ